MKNYSHSIQGKIIVGFLIIILMIIGMFCIVLYEWNQSQNLKKSVSEINSEYKNLNKIYLCIISLTTKGESVIAWDDSDYNKYHKLRINADSVLSEIKLKYSVLAHRNSIDSLRVLLERKEMHLRKIMKAVQCWEKSDSLLSNELPTVAKRTVGMKTITQKKKGIAGLFGKKDTIQIPYITNEIQDFNKKLSSVRNVKTYLMETSLDSLRLQNRLLNQKLYDFVYYLDNQIQQIFIARNLEIRESQQETFKLFSIMICFTVFLIIISFLIIRSDLYKEEKIKLKLKQSILENEDLLEMRKKIILTISHDIRGPIGNINNCADLVSDTREKKKREIYLNDIRYSCQHVLHLVNNLMDAYRINEAGDLHNDIPFYLNRFLKRISDEFSRKATSKGLILYSEYKGSNVIVKGDADKLEQVLANLLTNAIKFTSRGNVNFHSEYSEGKLRIEIRDTGIGMDEETLKRIFAPFERAAQDVNSEGFGLGLFLTKGLIKVLEGKMNVESTLGKGSVFRLELPLPETDELVEEDKTDHNTITILPKNVLVVDDDPIQLKIAEDMLGRRGVSCKTCMNAREVVAALENSEYDLILTDVQMPDTDGFGLLRLLRNSDIGNSRTVPVAVMTARGDGNSGIYEKEGFVGCIHKPFNIHGLLAFLSTIISRTQVSVSGDFDFSSLLENTDDYSYMLSLVVMESEKELEEMESADRITDRETMRKIIHRMIPVWEMLGKDNILRDFQRLLHDSDSQNETVHEHAIQIMEWLKILIEETKKELKKYENSDC
ncbi:hybrid sensor histidine kinase/response regulator [Bacteroides difficilis]|uniref:histidine kinase n=1 Tax=Bacteroides difficilis TaxID=2763021 RepID=A0ABR7CI04_9BACE|nr:hybrid sensor histidine kinase/response regulator [Bacteroides difficilis]MBC5607430.1 response regulator [Bacteroides difficilis]